MELDVYYILHVWGMYMNVIHFAHSASAFQAGEYHHRMIACNVRAAQKRRRSYIYSLSLPLSLVSHVVCLLWPLRVRHISHETRVLHSTRPPDRNRHHHRRITTPCAWHGALMLNPTSRHIMLLSSSRATQPLYHPRTTHEAHTRRLLTDHLMRDCVCVIACVSLVYVKRRRTSCVVCLCGAHSSHICQTCTRFRLHNRRPRQRRRRRRPRAHAQIAYTHGPRAVWWCLMYYNPPPATSTILHSAHTYIVLRPHSCVRRASFAHAPPCLNRSAALTLLLLESAHSTAAVSSMALAAWPAWPACLPSSLALVCAGARSVHAHVVFATCALCACYMRCI